MAIVARGLGLPEDGALVVGGLGVSEADLNAMFATLAGSSTLSAILSASGVTEPDQSDNRGGGGFPVPRLLPKVGRPLLPLPATPGRMSALLVGWSDMSADLSMSLANFDDLDFELLLALDLV